MTHQVIAEDWYRPQGMGYTVYVPQNRPGSSRAIIVAPAATRDWYYAEYDGRTEKVLKGGFPTKFAAMLAVQGVFPVGR